MSTTVAIITIPPEDESFLEIVKRLSDEEYRRCLIFRQDLYSLSKPLLRRIKNVLKKFQSELKAKSPRLSDQEVADRCESEKRYRSQINPSVVGWDKNANGWRILARYFENNFSTKENDLGDPSILLKLVKNCKLFSINCQHYARQVLNARNSFYGHTQELQLSRDAGHRVMREIQYLRYFIANQ